MLDIFVTDVSLARFAEFMEGHREALEASYLKREWERDLRNVVGIKGQGRARMNFRLEIDEWSTQKLVEEYISKLFHHAEDRVKVLTSLEKYFEKRHLLRVSTKIRLEKGENVEALNEIFTDPSELESIKEKSEIKILPSNPRRHRVQDDVELKVHLKNVKNIDVKIYEMNLQKNNLEDGRPLINDEIDLSFLKPASQFSQVNPVTNPFQVTETAIKVDIPKKHGLFIVDLQGERVTSRAVINKGSIVCIDKVTEAGKEFSFYDEEGKALTEAEGLKVWARRRPQKLINNTVAVEFPDQYESIDLVASLGNYAQKFIKGIDPESYGVNVGYIYNCESFAVGSKAKILLHGRLKLGNKKVTLGLLQNIKARVTVTSNLAIKTFFSFDFKEWSDSEDLALEFPIQSYSESINIELEAEIKLMNKKEQKLTHSKTITIDLGERRGNTNFLDLYLHRDVNKGYVVSLLGANGEPKPRVELSFNFDIRGVDSNERKNAHTNKDGQVILGKLPIVSKFSAELRTSEVSFQRSWKIDETQEGLNYSDCIWT